MTKQFLRGLYSAVSKGLQLPSIMRLSHFNRQH
jgi:hypothetical protein